MKRYLIIITVFAVLFTSCKKDTENVSFVTTFADFDMKGNQYQSLVVGQKYVEQGVSAKEGEKSLEIITRGVVDESKAGVYEITYSAINSDNFPGSVKRYVAVLPSTPTVDISGSFFYKANPTFTTTMTKLAPGFYTFGNVWGASVIPAYILSTNGVDLTLPLSQLSGFGRVQGTGKIAGNEMTLMVDLLDQGISNRARIWVKN
ncbi:immunoglobulin-like domain-containing protein [Sphingobacterium detergens]|uniref:Uncharacterized protein DUF5011 n=1 Tax=Sphingobacterium detergens TaxID=1145106 RepID=A0A420B7I5_SPHD1|nr:immunoglobulin-like domain-containing protein [Sphingobacterium detergens]RKE52608.1 uncharacterized protein DUF5011 [Sphingobacterium detergens]